MTAPTQKPILIIGLVGLAGSGKDTVAGMLISHLSKPGIQHMNERAVPLAFADPIRTMCFDLMQYAGVQNPSSYLSDRKLKEAVIPEQGVSYRHLAQTLGTEWGQQRIGRDVWIRVLDQRMQEYCKRGAMHFVIPDVRFAPEVDWLRSQGAVIWRVERPGVEPVREHVSESGTATIRSNRVILNNGTLEDLRATVGAELARLNYELGMPA